MDSLACGAGMADSTSYVRKNQLPGKKRAGRDSLGPGALVCKRFSRLGPSFPGSKRGDSTNCSRPMALYCDTNLLIRLYVKLPESAVALQQLDEYRPRGSAKIPVTWLHQVETFNAFEQLVFLTRNGDDMRMTPEKAALAAAQFEEDLADGHGLESTPLPVNDLIKQARQLAQRHTAKHGFRAYDVAHVATALLLGCNEFWSFDAKASQLAALEGLKVLKSRLKAKTS